MHLLIKSITISTLIISSTLLAISESFSFKFVSVSASTNIIRKPSIYTLKLSRDTDNSFSQTAWNSTLVPPNSNISIQFPIQYQNIQSTAICTSVTIDNTLYTSINCIKSQHTITIINLITTASYIQQVTVIISNIFNPSPALRTSQFYGTIGIDGSAANSLSTIQLQAGSLVSCSMKFQPGYVNRYSSVSILVQAIQAMASDTSIRISFPLKYLRDALSQSILGTTQSILGTTSSQSCSTNLTTYGILCNAVTTSLNIITVLYAFPINSTNTASFSLQNILSPPTTETIDQILIETFTSNAIPYDTCTTTIQNLQPAILNGITITSNNAFLVNAILPIKISLTLTDYMPNTDSLLLDFSNTLSIYTPIYILTSITANITANLTSTPITSTFRLINSNSTVMNFTQNRNINAGSTITMNISSLICPSNINISPSITISIYSLGYLKMTGTATIPIQYSTINSISSVNSIKTINQLSTYMFIFTIPDTIPIGGMIILYLPTEIVLNNNTINNIFINSLTLTTYKTLSTAENAISMYNLPTYAKNTTINLTISSIMNPPSPLPLNTTLTIKTYSSSDQSNLISIGQYTPSNDISYTSPQTLLFSVSSSSAVVKARNVSLTFLVNNTVVIPKNGTIVIYADNLPELVVNNITALCEITLLTTNTSSSTSCQITIFAVNPSLITLAELNFLIPSHSSLNITINNVFTNPASTYPLTSFAVMTYTSNHIELQRSSTNTVQYLIITTPNAFVYYHVSKDNYINSEKTSYYFTFIQESPFNVSSSVVNTIILSFPLEIGLQYATCTSCIVNTLSNTIQYTLNNTSLNSSPNSFSFQISTLTNPVSLQPLSTSISAQSLLNNIYTYSYSSSVDNQVELSNTFPSNISSISASYSNYNLFESNALSLAITSTSSVSTFVEYYSVTLSSQFLGLNSNFIYCTNVTIGWSCNYSPSKAIMFISRNNNASSLNLTLKINNFTNPISFASTTPLICNISSYSSNAYLINSYIQINASYNIFRWQPSCTSPCKTCSSLNATSCLSCYSLLAITPNIYYSLSTSSCLNQCSLTEFLILSNNTCFSCDSTCYTCINSSLNCLSCSIGGSLYLYNNSCVNATGCPASTYANNVTSQCLPCQFPCLTCHNISYCLSCVGNLSFYLNGCVMTCPALITVYNSANKSCVGCESICLTCSVSVSNCTSCSLTALSYIGSCLATCPISLYEYNNTCVEVCVLPCQTCEGNADHCTSCPSQLYLFNATCLHQCPITYYQNITSICSLCSSLPSFHCSHCQTNINCTQFGGNLTCNTSNLYELYSCSVCDASYVLVSDAISLQTQTHLQNISSTFNNNTTSHSIILSHCFAVVPDGYISINSLAIQCNKTTYDCLTCSPTPINCLACATKNYYNGLCISACPVTHYSLSKNISYNSGFASSKTCVRCVTPCNTCLDSLACLSCANNFYLQLGTNICGNANACANLTYPNSSLWRCSACISPCVSCTSISKCTSCISSTFLFLNECLVSCPLSLYANTSTSTCLPCTSPCQYCSNLTSTICLTCISSYYLYPLNNTCLLTCPVGYQTNNDQKICVNCTSPCLICNYTDCFRCGNYNLTQYYLYNNICVKKCPQGYYPAYNNITYSCLQCSLSCQTCTNGSYCLMCMTLTTSLNSSYKYLSNGVCILDCPTTLPIVLFRSNESQYYCLPCQEKYCLQCYSNDECYLCVNSTALENGTCYDICPVSYNKTYNSNTSAYQCTYIQPNKQLTIVIEPQGIAISVALQFPCTIAAGAFSLMAICIKIYQSYCVGNGNTHIFALLVSAFAIPQLFSLLLVTYAHFMLKYKTYLLGVQYFDPYLYIFFICILLHIITGIYTLISMCQVCWNDKFYMKWQQQSNSCSKLYLCLISTCTILNSKINNALWCGIASLPLLESTSKLKYITHSSSFSCLISLTFITSLITLIAKQVDAIELYWIYYDCMIVMSGAMVLSLLALKRLDTLFVYYIHYVNAGTNHDQFIILPLHKRVTSSQEFLIHPIQPEKQSSQDDSILHSPLSSSNIFRKYHNNYRNQQKNHKHYKQQSFSESSQQNTSKNIMMIVIHENQSDSNTFMDEIISQNNQAQRKSNEDLSLQCSILSQNNYDSALEEKKIFVSANYYQASNESDNKIQQQKIIDSSKHIQDLILSEVVTNQAQMGSIDNDYQENEPKAYFKDYQGQLLDSQMESNFAVFQDGDNESYDQANKSEHEQKRKESHERKKFQELNQQKQLEDEREASHQLSLLIHQMSKSKCQVRFDEKQSREEEIRQQKQMNSSEKVALADENKKAYEKYYSNGEQSYQENDQSQDNEEQFNLINISMTNIQQLATQEPIQTQKQQQMSQPSEEFKIDSLEFQQLSNISSNINSYGSKYQSIIQQAEQLHQNNSHIQKNTLMKNLSHESEQRQLHPNKHPFENNFILPITLQEREKALADSRGICEEYEYQVKEPSIKEHSEDHSELSIHSQVISSKSIKGDTEIQNNSKVSLKNKSKLTEHERISEEYEQASEQQPCHQEFNDNQDQNEILEHLSQSAQSRKTSHQNEFKYRNYENILSEDKSISPDRRETENLLEEEHQLEFKEGQGNQFRIKTKRKLPKKFKNYQEKQKIIYVDDKKFKTLKRQASLLQKQTIRNSIIKKQIENVFETGQNSFVKPNITAKKQRSIEKSKDIQQIYLNKPENLPQKSLSLDKHEKASNVFKLN